MTFSRPGAVDLSALAQPAGASSRPAAGGYVVDVSEQNFQTDALEASMQHVVVLSLWSPRSPQSQTFNELLGTVVTSYEGRLTLAQVDVDTNPAIAQALGAQGVPLVVGLVKGQPVPLFQGTADEADVRQYFDQLLTVAEQAGLTGRAQAPDGAAAPEEEEPVDDPRFAAADAAFANGDMDGAVAEYEKLLNQYPGDTEIAERLAGVQLMGRTRDADLTAARAAAADAPDDLDAQLLVADLDVSGGHVEDAFDRLIALVKRLDADDRERVRERLLELFTVVGAADPRVAAARRALATALF
ncbi:MAG TPA: tetratricopeptide repeat protein [Nocardioides sp.]|nr:tetratricopeptide repeat protein [Nocardioides sp.]